MLSKKEEIKISKFLSLVLRHQPGVIGITLDKNGWTDVETLIENSKKKGINLDLPTLKYVVETNEKKRFAFDEKFKKIRANQGHSVEIDLGFKPQVPPEILFHGTGIKSVEIILKEGLEKRKRHHVHLSKDIETALNVGKRHGKPIVFKVFAEKMYKDNFVFFLSDNGIWLTEFVPPEYLYKIS